MPAYALIEPSFTTLFAASNTLYYTEYARLSVGFRVSTGALRLKWLFPIGTVIVEPAGANVNTPTPVPFYTVSANVNATFPASVTPFEIRSGLYVDKVGTVSSTMWGW